MSFTTRFAPSPTGPLHLGHAYSAILAHDLAKAENGTFLLRIEDIDQSRSRPAWEAQIYSDLAWLGLTWPDPVLRQSDRLQSYRDTLQNLWEAGFLFVCNCSRRDVTEAASAPQEGADPVMGPDGIIYPGTCRPVGHATTGAPFPKNQTLRLNMKAAIASLEIASVEDAKRIVFDETGEGPTGETGHIVRDAAALNHSIGDIVLGRKGMGTSYHLSVVLDDAAQSITHVVRGQDLFDATSIHVILQKLLGLPTPIYHHHRLIRDNEGKRLAKRDDARSITTYRAEGATPDDIRRLVGL